MAPKKTRFVKKSRKTKVWKKKMPIYKNKTSVQAGLGFPKRMTMVHKYSGQSNPSSTSGALTTYTYKCNGLFDPNTTGTGHQPMYFDQMSALYNHYTVIGSKIKITVVPVIAANIPFVCGVFLNDDSTTTPTTQSDMMEQTSGKYRYITSSSNSPIVFESKWSCAKTFGKTAVFGNPYLTGTTTTDPTETSQWTYWQVPLDGVTTGSLYVSVNIEYIAVWSELKDMAGS